MEEMLWVEGIMVRAELSPSMVGQYWQRHTMIILASVLVKTRNLCLTVIQVQS